MVQFFGGPSFCNVSIVKQGLSIGTRVVTECLAFLYRQQWIAAVALPHGALSSPQFLLGEAGTSAECARLIVHDLDCWWGRER